MPFVPFLCAEVPSGRCRCLLGYRARLCLPRILRGLLTVLAYLVLLVSMAGLTPLYHHRTADTYWMFSGLMLWSGICLTMMNSSSSETR